MAIALLAGVTRGYCGFGFAMLVALGLSGFMAPVEAVPVALLLDLLAAAGLLQVAARHAHRRVLGRLVLGMLLAVGLGVWLLSRMPAAPMRMVIALLSLSGGMALLCRVGRRDVVPEEGRSATAGRWAIWAGGVSGLAMSMASAGGPPLMLYLLSTRLSTAQLRGTAIVFFAICSSCSLLGLGLSGVLGAGSLVWVGWLIVPAWLGNAFGQWLFHRAGPISLRYTVAPLLILLSLWMLLPINTP
ncbi:sulfite exporter TauE/SafE family protein [Kushneria phosphatilytica]|uniref:Probable membrane transporter protein n=3 Tax=Kushneria phosphatilytica TaxID=657387 RepID=A0A5C1A3M1_9GAMM|nr:sulfite exporter TauE/SafE family protein [Kushneria phosphatilytica]